MGRFDDVLDRVQAGTAELFGRDTKQVPDTKSQTPSEVYSTYFSVSRPEDDLDEFYREYESNPFLARPIDSVVEEVVEPGWWIDAGSADAVDELTEFGRNNAIIGGQTHQGTRELVKDMVRQHLVRGIYLGEKVTDEKGRHVAVNSVNPSTFELYTREDQAILLPPDFKDPSGEHELKQTDGGKTAAFVQYDEVLSEFEDRDERRFARDEMIYWPRNPDTGSLFGQSAIKPVYNRAKALRQKLSDNDDAIAMKAWPMVLFKLGTPEYPFTEDEIEEFMEAYEEETLGPGMYQGVPGDVEVEEFAGETADIEAHVRTDVNYIVAGMPGPKFTVGTFDDDVAKSVAKAQERRFKKTVRSIRRDVEDKLTPYFREAAESWGIPDEHGIDVSSIEFHLGRPGGEVAPEDVNGSTIRYTSDVSDSNSAQSDSAGSQSGQDQNDSDDAGSAQQPNARPDNRDNPDARTQRGPNVTPDAASASQASFDTSQLADPDLETPSWQTAELADPRLVSTTEIDDELADVIEPVLTHARDSVLGELDETWADLADLNETRLRDRVLAAGQDRRRSDDLDEVAMNVFTAVVNGTLDTLGQDSHRPHLDLWFAPRHTELVRDHAEQLIRDMDSVLYEIGSQVATQVNIAGNAGEPAARAIERVENVYSDDVLRDRAEIIADMHTSRLVNEVKLMEYKRKEDAIGVAVTNPCTDATTPFCQEAAGCGDRESPTAMFDADDSIGVQLADQISHEGYEGFQPIGIPPYHFRCRSELVPIYEE